MGGGRTAGASENLTILLTTHYLEEADRLAERVAIVSRGRIVVEGTPEELKAGLHGESVSVELKETTAACTRRCRSCRSSTAPTRCTSRGRSCVPASPNGAQAIPTILSALDGSGFPVMSVTTARPSLDDVYLHYTGRDFAAEDEGSPWRKRER